FNLVLSAFTKLLPAEKRGLALGAGTAAGSFGQFLFAPIGVALIDNFGWQQALSVFGFLMLLIIPLSLALSTPPVSSTANAAPADEQTFTKALATLAFISFPITPFSAIAFGAVSGLTWLSTVPPTSALVALMFGTRWFATLYGFAFVSHQVGGFLGVWLGGIVFERFGSY